jgi:hypothetical protein
MIIEALYNAHLAYGNDQAYIVMINEELETNLWD